MNWQWECERERQGRYLTNLWDAMKIEQLCQAVEATKHSLQRYIDKYGELPPE